MKLTNRHNLPDLYCEAVDLFESDYDRGESDHTATELIKPVRISVLTKRHWKDLEEDVSDRVWAFSGQVKHLIFERLAKKNPERYIAEKRMYATVDGKKISGKLDLYDTQTSTLWDYKESSVWKFVLGDTADWEAQANINRYCLMNNVFAEPNGFIEPHVTELQNLVILKDWKAREADKKDDYPQCAVHIVDLPMWTDAKVEKFIRERITAIRDGQENPPVCTPDERWERGEKWAVMKRGRKSAVKLWDDEELARDNAAGVGFYVEHRPAEPTRCLLRKGRSYCPVSQFCDFGRKVNNQRALGIESGVMTPNASIEHQGTLLPLT